MMVFCITAIFVADMKKRLLLSAKRYVQKCRRNWLHTLPLLLKL